MARPRTVEARQRFAAGAGRAVLAAGADAALVERVMLTIVVIGGLSLTVIRSESNAA
ncbi:hypothetical protein [Oceaniovalibus sp. ACAM 378]|uniref:hypothetical protein n=1 Tax=Oceaniovalibus sp. ACAM 378 TaxID=2599923 RepID=UPI001651CAED|nr:hypothetical protein [Oceaniovalibus sp. ACAM 378]